MKVEPCGVCGNTDLNLVDGFYYCSECGTQDTNIQNTVIEQTILTDGAITFVNSRKFTTQISDGIQMSGEWYKWHAFNFILAGLSDELMLLGAKPSFKMKLLWVWTRYIKKFQVKDSERLSHSISENNVTCNSKMSGVIEGDNLTDSDDAVNMKKKVSRKEFKRDVKVVTKGVIMSIIYVALNLDASDIQLSHLFRFIREGRLSFYDCIKFIPKEINIKSIPQWKSFVCCQNEYKSKNIRSIAMTLFKRLDLGFPLVPDLRTIIDSYTKELCLPSDFKDLVFSLIHKVPCDFLDIDEKSKQKLVRIPDYECVAMSYVLVALKMCFGLDSDYEVKISDQIERINERNNYLKSYKIGLYSDHTLRLFCFREWVQYLQLRKSIVSKYYLPMAQQYNLNVDDCIFIDHLKDRHKRIIHLVDKITMDILNKIFQNNEMTLIPKSDFPPTLTPLSSYIEVILQYLQEPDLKLLLSEDFSQYSLAYACKDFMLMTEMNIVEPTGITEQKKKINAFITGVSTTKNCDASTVYVRNCENKNWLKTKPPSLHHISNENGNGSDRECDDYCHDSNLENTHVLFADTAIDDSKDYTDDIKLEAISEEIDSKGIFDDLFQDDDMELNNIQTFRSNDTNSDVDNKNYVDNDVDNNKFNTDFSENLSLSSEFDPTLFNKDEVIKQLVKAACKKYKIPIPRQYDPKEPKKRKSNVTNIESDQSKSKRIRISSGRIGEFKKCVDNIIDSYYNILQNDIFYQMSEQVMSVIHNLDSAPNELSLRNSSHNNKESEQNWSCLHFKDTQGSNLDENLEHMILENNRMDVSSDDDAVKLENLVSKGDPNFDENMYDIKQLFIKLKNELDLEDAINTVNDLETVSIIDKKIEQNMQGEFIYINKSSLKCDDSGDTVSDEDKPLSELQLEKRLEKKNIIMKEKLNTLIKNPKSISNFNYWVRHYKSKHWTKTFDSSEKFDLEIMSSCSKSFTFLLRECAGILDCSTYSLYKCMQDIEIFMINRII